MELKTNIFRQIKPTPEDVEVRVGRHEPNRTELLIYKTRQVDQRILDSIVGMSSWEAIYPEGKPDYCEIAISFKDQGQSVIRKRGDFGEGKTPKAIATDAFKRAAFSWGILTCLKDTPILAWRKSDCHSWNDIAKAYEPITKDRFVVTSITAHEDKVTSITIKNLDSNVVRTFGCIDGADGEITTDSIGGSLLDAITDTVKPSSSSMSSRPSPIECMSASNIETGKEVASRPSPIMIQKEEEAIPKPAEKKTRGRKKKTVENNKTTDEIIPMTLEDAYKLKIQTVSGSFNNKAIEEIFNEDKMILPVLYKNVKDIKEKEAVKLVIKSDDSVLSYCARNDEYKEILL